MKKDTLGDKLKKQIQTETQRASVRRDGLNRRMTGQIRRLIYDMSERRRTWQEVQGGTGKTGEEQRERQHWQHWNSQRQRGKILVDI